MKTSIGLAMVVAAASALAQRPGVAPHLGYVYPAGGKPGSTIQVTLGGQLLQASSLVVISGAGVQATVGEYDRPLTQKEAKELGDKLAEARKKLNVGRNNPLIVAKEAGLTEKDLRALQRFRQSRTDPKRQLNPQIAETVTLQLQIQPGAAAETHEIRLLTPAGLTNPVRFVVNSADPVSEEEPNDQTPQSIAKKPPFVVDGQVMPGDIDRFSFTASKGSRLTLSLATRSLVPYLADAVPGWFQGALTVFGPDGRELAYADHRLSDQEPSIGIVAPADGSYVVEVRDALFRGREDFVYRLSVSPTASQPRVRKPFLGLAEVPEAEPNESVAKAQPVPLDRVVAGSIGRPGDVDVFRVTGKAGQQIVAEVLARREGSQLDSSLQLIDASGKEIAFNDDADDKGSGTLPHQADSYLTATLPASGPYFLVLRDAQHGGGSGYFYRLRVGPPHPTFELRLAQSSLGIRAGMSAPLTVYVLRRDGFAGEVRLRLKNPPEGFGLSGAIIPAGADHVRLTVSGPANASTPVDLEIEGFAKINGKDVVSLAVPADDMMQAFAYHHLVPAQEFCVSVLGRSGRGSASFSDQAAVVRLVPGSVSKIRIAGQLGPILSRLRLSLDDAYPGLAIAGVSSGPDGTMVSIRVDPKAKPGVKGNLILVASLAPIAPPANARPGAAGRQVQLGCLPAIPFEIAGLK